VTGADDILDDLNLLVPRAPAGHSQPTTSGTLSAEEQAVLETLDAGETSLDDLVTKTRLPIQKVSSTLLALEMKRRVKALPGQHFVKL
jgi:DNA processing protein